MPPTSAPNMKRSPHGHANQRAGGKRLTLAEARANRAKPDFAELRAGARHSSAPASTPITIWRSWRSYIDWTPFFQTWELAGPYPAILSDDKVGKAATDLFNDAQKMLKKIIDGKWLHGQRRDRLLARQPATRTMSTTSSSMATRRGNSPSQTLHTLRQQMAREAGRPNLALSRFHRAGRAWRIISAALW